MTLKRIMAGAVAALALTAGASSAASISLGGSNGSADYYEYGYFGGVLTVEGEREGNFSFPDCILGCWEQEDVSRTGSGVGVTAGFLDNSQLDGLIDERLLFTFDTAVKIVSITFSAFNPLVDEYQIYNILNDGSDPSDWVTIPNNGANPFVFANGGLITNKLVIGTDGLLSAFRVSAIEIEPVPVPAAGLLLLGGLGAMAALRRKRKAA